MKTNMFFATKIAILAVAATFSFQAFASNQVVWTGTYNFPNNFMDKPSISNFIATLSKVFSGGIYVGRTAAGKTCSLNINYFNGVRFAPDVDFIFGGALPVPGEFSTPDFPIASNAYDRLLGLHSNAIGNETQVQFGLYVQGVEEPGNYLFLSVSGKDGVPSSYTLGEVLALTPPEFGGPGTAVSTIPSSSITNVGTCYNLQSEY